MQHPWRMGQLTALSRVLLVLSAALPSAAARAEDAASQRGYLRRASVMRKGSPSRAPATTDPATADGSRLTGLAQVSYPGDEYIVGKTGKNGTTWADTPIPSENVGDKERGDGTCKGFRMTLNCDPEGPRDCTKDKKCDEVILANESGYCECGGLAQFAASQCDHRPFTCDVMCLKYAVLTNKQAWYQGQKFAPEQAKFLISKFLESNQTDTVAQGILLRDLYMHAAKQKEKGATIGKEAIEAVDKYMKVLDEGHERDKAEAERMKKEFYEGRKDPWEKLRGISEELINTGKAMQDVVTKSAPILPCAQRATIMASQAVTLDPSQCRHNSGRPDPNCCSGDDASIAPSKCAGGYIRVEFNEVCGERIPWCQANGCKRYTCKAPSITEDEEDDEKHEEGKKETLTQEHKSAMDVFTKLWNKYPAYPKGKTAVEHVKDLLNFKV